MVSNMSSISRRVAASILSTGLETSRRRGSGKVRIKRGAMRGDVRASRCGVNACVGRANRVRRAGMSPILLALDPSRGSGAIAALVMAALLLTGLIGTALLIARAARARGRGAARQPARAEEIEARVAELARIQADTAGRIHMLGETLGGRQAELSRTVAERLDAVTHRVGQSMEATTRHTVESLRHLHERLVLIDSAQKNLTDLSSQVTSLREVLANKQARGAFGQ